MKIFFKSESEQDTKEVAETLGRVVLSGEAGNEALVVALEGELGAGKTVFVRGFTQGLGIKKTITSPTFVLMKRFPIGGGFYKNFFHIDAYRLKNGKIPLELGLKEIIRDPKNIVAVEWASRIKKCLGGNVLRIFLEHGNKNEERLISASS